jgi:hypothetical protein
MVSGKYVIKNKGEAADADLGCREIAKAPFWKDRRSPAWLTHTVLAQANAIP